MPDVGQLFVGIDVGTGGVRALAVTDTGMVVGRASVALPQEAVCEQGGAHEQAPEAWIDSDHHRWPNNFFRAQGLFSMARAHAFDCRFACNH